MTQPETLPYIARYRVTNPDAADYGREGIAVNVLDEGDLQQRTVWIVLDLDGVQTAFHKDELMKVSNVRQA